MGRKRFILRRHLIQMTALYGGIGLFLPLLTEAALMACCIKKEVLPAKYALPLLLLLAAVQIAGFCVVLALFRRKIYEPVAMIEKVIHGVALDGQEIRQVEVDEKNELHGLYEDLNAILHTLEELAAKESRAILLKKQAELDALQSQINPHFLYNTLESIRGQAMVYGIREIEVMTKALANLFRYSISNEGSLVPLSMELKNIDNYFMIQQCRFNNKFEKIEKIEKDVLDCMIPKLLIQPIVENAIQHGLEPKIEKGRLTLQAYRTRTNLIIHVIDDGMGIEESKVNAINEALRAGTDSAAAEASGMRIGVLNVNARIRLAFGPEYGLRVFSTENVGTDVAFCLPVKEAGEAD